MMQNNIFKCAQQININIFPKLIIHMKMSRYSPESGKITISSDCVHFKDSKTQSTAKKKHVMHLNETRFDCFSNMPNEIHILAV